MGGGTWILKVKVGSLNPERKDRISIGREEEIGWTILSRPAEILHSLRELKNHVSETQEDKRLDLDICGNKWMMVMET